MKTARIQANGVIAAPKRTRRKDVPPVRFVRHHSTLSLLRAIAPPKGSAAAQVASLAERMGELTTIGVWGFADASANPPAIHYWHRQGYSRARLVALLSSEVWRLAKKRFPVKRDEWRAHEYATTAYLALRQVLRRGA